MKTLLTSVLFVLALAVNAQASENEKDTKSGDKEKTLVNGRVVASNEISHTVKTVKQFFENSERESINTQTLVAQDEKAMVQALTSVKEWKGTKFKGVYR
jgi:ABC-type phosphate/phosphonate transport system substrate-binding protein